MHLHTCTQMHACVYVLMFKDVRIVLIPVSIPIVVISVFFIRWRTISHISDFCKITFPVVKMKSHHTGWCDLIRAKNKCGATCTIIRCIVFVSFCSCLKFLTIHTQYSLIVFCKMSLISKIQNLLWMQTHLFIYDIL